MTIYTAAVCLQAGWRAFIYPVEVGCKGYTGTSTQRFLKSLGITGSKLRKTLKDLAEEGEQGTIWLWLRRKDKVWGKQVSKGWLQGAAGRRPCSTTLRCSRIKGEKHQ